MIDSPATVKLKRHTWIDAQRHPHRHMGTKEQEPLSRNVEGGGVLMCVCLCLCLHLRVFMFSLCMLVCMSVICVHAQKYVCICVYAHMYLCVLV